ncbi:unnamed protein product [Clonostachys chloroleuca]|uniref:TPR domain protein n=1 Tax=Clonostachys chloroleuca TaxID=1926264 RepID=A0AA35M180_9HYPO|nr:unnamed protein product [Clonostachys chloroleuca]
MSADENPVDAIPASAEYFYLGEHTRTITTSNPDAQIWFDRGLNWAFGFNHAEASRCFEQVTLHDPDCAIGYWGVAYAGGPNYNKVWKAFDQQDLAISLPRCRAFARKALGKRHLASEAEQALIDAIQVRFPEGQNPSDAEFLACSAAYADAMREVLRKSVQDDLDILALVSDALMNMAPWSLYESRTGKPNLATPVLEIEKILDRAISLPGADSHPGLLHLYIHLKEMSMTPEAAIPAADNLRRLVTDSGHLQHMPSHIDVLVGDYRSAIAANARAIRYDAKYYEKQDFPFYRIYQLHDHHSLIYAAMLAGRRAIALDATDRMEAILTESLLRTTSPPMAEWCESFNAVRVHVMIRFGMWEEIKALALPTDQELYCVTIANIHYGKAVAYAATDDLPHAEEERDNFHKALAKVPNSRLSFPNRVVDILKVAHAMLDGEMEYRRGNFDEAFAHLRTAVKCDDALNYGEPWGWMLPTRHALGALLLEHGKVEEAARVYGEDLALIEGLASAHQHPNNVWALHGYHECLVRLGRSAEAHIIGQALKIALASADITITSSCFCRLGSNKSDSHCKC